jgi:uncharacterized protein
VSRSPSAPGQETPASDTYRPQQRALGFAFRLYKTLFSPLLHAISPSRCIYLPTCSEYAYMAISRFGLVRGSWLALKRFGRCHPWGEGGLDPVPECVSSGCNNVPASVAPNQNDADHLP